MKQNSRQKNLKGFTLAEVLITLVIVGVIAAITIPIIHNNYIEQVTVSKVKKFHSTMNQALRLAIANEGVSVDNWDIYEESINMKANKLISPLKPYLKIMKDCGYDTSKDCSDAGKIKALNGNFWHEDSSTYYRLILDDGAVMTIRTHEHNDSSKHKCGTDNGVEDVCGFIFYDVNGNKKPNTIGKDFFCFYIHPNHIIGHHAFNDCNKHSFGWACTNYILQHGDMNYPN